ncbi:MAG TPA: NADP oxidoreductase [Candidatus Hydrogenedentes bacterium]|nr:NADP oxidoreductase [Candidatus Hydrogenedentota bacterium]
MSKPLVATGHFTGCFGCHMSLLDIDERILDLVQLVEFDKSPINDIKTFTRPVDIGIVEGGISNDENAEVLREFRKNCKILIAIGACAITGGVPSMRNTVPLKECMEEAYLNGPTIQGDGVIPNDPELPVLLDRVYPVHEVVKVDYFLPGCPPSADTLWAALVALLKGDKLALPYELVKFD